MNGQSTLSPFHFQSTRILLRLAVGESADMIVNSKRVKLKVALDMDFNYEFKDLNEALVAML